MPVKVGDRELPTAVAVGAALAAPLVLRAGYAAVKGSPQVVKNGKFKGSSLPPGAFDALIVGGGPSGSVCAYYFAQVCKDRTQVGDELRVARPPTGTRTPPSLSLVSTRNNTHTRTRCWPATPAHTTRTSHSARHTTRGRCCWRSAAHAPDLPPFRDRQLASVCPDHAASGHFLQAGGKVAVLEKETFPRDKYCGASAHVNCAAQSFG